MPITIACALFADDVISVFLGPKWKAAGAIFRLLAPTILVFAIANPLSWLLTSIGRVGRLLKMGLVIAPIMILGYVLGLPYGPKGVAFAYSAVMLLWLIPLGYVGPARNDDCSARYSAGSEPPAGLQPGGWRARLLRAVSLRTIPVSIAPACTGRWRSCSLHTLGCSCSSPGRRPFYLDLLRTLRGSSSTPEETLITTKQSGVPLLLLNPDE